MDCARTVIIDFVLSIPLFSSFDKTTAAMQFVRNQWISAWSIITHSVWTA